jgi:hypothetical protein
MPRRSSEPNSRVRPLLAGTPTTLRKAHPGIRRIDVHAVQEGDVGWNWQRDQRFADDGVPTRIDCGNKRCRRGGYDLSGIVSSLAYTRHEHSEFSIRCEGDEGSPGGRRRGDPCTNRLRVTVKAELQAKSDGGDSATT